MSAPIDDSSSSSLTNTSFPIGGIVAIFVSIFVLACFFVACGITRRRSQQRKAQLIYNHNVAYNQQIATSQHPPSYSPSHPAVAAGGRREAPSGGGVKYGVNGANPYDAPLPARPGYGKSLPELRQDGVVEVPPPAYMMSGGTAVAMMS